jgi:hypothetical protein
MRGVPGSSKCGTSPGYSAHMKLREEPCRPCRDARNLYNKKLKYKALRMGGKASVDATGTRRRLQALARLGHTFEVIGRRMGVDKSVPKDYCGVTFVQLATAQKVKRVYEELSGTPGASTIARNRAIAKGWVAPLDWEGRNIDDPRALSHSQFSALVRAGNARRKAAA